MTAADMVLALRVRRVVFIDEQGVDPAIEIDEFDAVPAAGSKALHVILLEAGEPLATGRLLLGNGPSHAAHIGRVAVVAGQRGRGLGRRIMTALHELARQRGYREIALSAQTHAIGFYEGLGYEAEGGEFMEAGIAHREMRFRF